MAIEARNRSLPDWFTRIRTRQIVLPRFQRFEAWSHKDVAQLINTILQGLPVGAVLILEVGETAPFISRPIVGAPTDGERINEHLLDGQQRLTALWRALHNNYEDRTYFLYMEPDEETGMPYSVDSLARSQKQSDKERRPFWANDPKELWQRRMIPLDLLRPDASSPQAFRDWAKKAIEDGDEREKLADEIAIVRQQFASFNLPFLSLPVNTKPATALGVFIKMNTSAAPLSTYDVVVAQVEAGLGKSLHDLVADVRTVCPSMAAYYPPEDLVLYCSALLQGKQPGNSSYLEKDFAANLVLNWDIFLRGVSRAVIFLQEERIFDAARLPTDVIVPVLVAVWGLAPSGLDREGQARTLLRKYVWRSSFSSRYEKSTSTRSLADFLALKASVAGDKAALPPVLDDAQYPLPSSDELLSAGWPVRKERLARAILALALRHGGLDLADGSPVTRENLAKREYHHLFPVAYLGREGIPEGKAYVSLNCGLVTWRTNRNISDKEPERYLAERRNGTELGEAEVKARLTSHLIPYDEMVAGDYQAFLQKRSELVHTAMTRLCGGAAVL